MCFSWLQVNGHTTRICTVGVHHCLMINCGCGCVAYCFDVMNGNWIEIHWHAPWFLYMLATLLIPQLFQVFATLAQRGTIQVDSNSPLLHTKGWHLHECIRNGDSSNLTVLAWSSKSCSAAFQHNDMTDMCCGYCWSIVAVGCWIVRQHMHQSMV